MNILSSSTGLNTGRRLKSLLIGLVLVLLILPISAKASSKVIVNDYPDGWNGIEIVSIKKVFYIEDYEQINVVIDVPKLEVPSNPSDVDLVLEKAYENFAERFFAAVKEEKDEINFVLVKNPSGEKPSPHPAPALSGSPQKSVDSLDTPVSIDSPASLVTAPSSSVAILPNKSQKQLLINIKLVGMHPGSMAGSTFVGPGVTYLLKKNKAKWEDAHGPLAAVMLEGEIIENEANVVVATFRHRIDRGVDMFRGYKGTLNKVVDNIADEIANFIGDFSR